MIITIKCDNCGFEKKLNVKAGYPLSQELCDKCKSQGTLIRYA